MLWLLPILIRRGVGSSIAKPLAWVANVLIVAALVGAAVLYVRNVILHHDASIASTAVQDRDKDLSLEAYNRVMEATEAADTNQAARDDIEATNDKELSHEAAKGDDGAVGVGTRSVLERMRDQQAAGRR
jgi:hypothetical protein